MQSALQGFKHLDGLTAFMIYFNLIVKTQSLL